MAEDMDFDSFENLDDLDWSEMEKGIEEGAQSADSAPGADAGQGEPVLGSLGRASG